MQIDESLPRIDRYTCCFENPVMESRCREHRWNLNRRYIDGIFVVVGSIMIIDMITIFKDVGMVMPVPVLHPLLIAFFFGFLFTSTQFRKRRHEVVLVVGASLQNLYQIYLNSEILSPETIVAEKSHIEALVIPPLLMVFVFVLLPFRFILTMGLALFTMAILTAPYLEAIEGRYEFLFFGFIMPFLILAVNKWRTERISREDYSKTVSLGETRNLMQQTLQRYFGEALSDKILTQDGDL